MKWHLGGEKALFPFTLYFVSFSAQFTSVSIKWTVYLGVKVPLRGAWWKTARSPPWIEFDWFLGLALPPSPPQTNSKLLGFLSVASVMLLPLTASAVSKCKCSFTFWQQIHYFSRVWSQSGWAFVHGGIHSRINEHFEVTLRERCCMCSPLFRYFPIETYVYCINQRHVL